MDRRRTRRATLRRRPSETPKPTIFEQLKPDFQWDQLDDDTHHRLVIHFPGFVRQEINVEADNAGRLIKITGRSTRTDETTTRTITVDESYQVPKDAILEEMSMKFQDGYLTIMIPIQREREIGDQKHRRSHDHGHKDFVEGPAESTAVEKKDELIQEEEMPKSDKQKNLDENAIHKKVESDEKKDEPTPTTKMLTSIEEMSKSDDTLQELEKHKIAAAGESNDDDAMIQREKESVHMTHDEEKDGYIQKETPTKSGELMAKGGEEEGPKTAGSRKRKAIWTGLLEKKKRSTKIILVAVVAFTLGFYASHMLRGESKQARMLSIKNMHLN